MGKGEKLANRENEVRSLVPMIQVHRRIIAYQKEMLDERKSE